ncbi:hypothetical protein PENTCL1PPCAC_7737 [Pristionchus entomophagus]|uniref:Uncharacterized protein n=1 Tax=Pristionchus entomophagus TaxID=358040 RepID=A0AAV5SSY6_9BILA|nr:hypothetical protein PENTCL1PPCAC_7737 [Pristionchus entomophagus]
MDDMKQYRAVCASRVNRLERFKKTRSFCSLDQETNNHDSAYASSAEPDCRLHASSSSSDLDDDVRAQDTFEMIKEKMISLMEDDVSLLQQLMALSDKINEVKKGRGLLPRSLSQTSLSDGFDREADEEEDLFDDDVAHGFAASASAVTTLYLNEDDDAKPSSSKAPPPQYFSRKNSVLRIPIPPRASNRINRRPSDMARHARPLHIDAAAASTVTTTASSTTSSTVCSPFTRPSPALSSTTSSASSTVSSASGAKILQRSSASSDSGRASSGSSCGSPSPTF